MLVPLACTVRGCGQPLARDDRRLVCPAGHAFDIARSGYISLLQPQDRRSLASGDPSEAVAARARLLEAGVGRAVIDAIVSRALRLAPAGPAGNQHETTPTLVAADLGCGSGELLGALAAARDVCGIGIDLSTAAIDAAARRFPSLTWIVANADRRLPLLDAGIHLVVSLNGRRNPDECARVLRPDGMLIVAVPAPDDLIELRAQVQGEAVTRDRADAVVAAHAPRFDLIERFTVSTRHALDGDALRALLSGTYRAGRTSMRPRADALDALEVTVSSDVCVLGRR